MLGKVGESRKRDLRVKWLLARFVEKSKLRHMDLHERDPHLVFRHTTWSTHRDQCQSSMSLAKGSSGCDQSWPVWFMRKPHWNSPLTSLIIKFSVPDGGPDLIYRDVAMRN